MSATELLEPILKGGIRSVNFFNGRLLSAEDLSDEQGANRLGRGLLGQAVGEGVAYGLEVSRAAAAADAAAGVVTVAAGLAVNRRGQPLMLPAQTDLSLVRQAGAGGAPAAAGFRDCQQLPGGVAASGQGVYLLTIAPSEGREGRAPVSGLGAVSASCGARYAVEGVSFRLVQLLGPTELGAEQTLRNRVAYQCFGVETLKAFEGAPFGPPPRRYGLLDGLRPNVLTDCEVPLAAVYWKNGINFIDLWSARRRISGASSASERWGALLDDRRAAEAEAMLLQFQDHVAALREGSANLTSSKAETFFAYLPSVGLLPVGAQGFNWQTFLGPHAPPEATSLDEGLLRSVVQRALLLGPVKINPFASASTPGQAPPVPLAVYRVPSNSDFVLFARSPRGRLRVMLGAANTGAQAGQIYAESRRTSTRYYASVGGAGGIYPISELEAGVYSVTVDVAGFPDAPTEGVVVVAGRTTDFSLVSGAPGSITVTVRNKTTGQAIGSAVQSVTAVPSQGGAPTQGAPAQGGQWSISNLAAGSYTVTAAATDFVTASASGVAVTSGQAANVTIALDPVVTSGVIGLEVSDQLSGLRIDSVVLTARATNAQTAAVTQGAKGGNGLWAFANLPPGTYNVEVTATNYQTKTVSGVALTAGQTQTVQVAMQASPGSIALTINDRATGAAISDKVTAVTATIGQTTFNGSRGSDGRWTVGGLPPGTYAVVVTAAGYQTETAPNVSVQAAQAKPLAVTLQPVAAAPGSILLAVTDEVTSTAVDNQVTSVSATSGQITFSGVRGNDGRWSIANLPPGTYSVAVAATNYQTKTVPGVEVVSNQVKTLSVTMQPLPGSIKLTVTDANTNAVINDKVTAVTATRGQSSFTGTKGADGKWSIANLTPGTYSLTANATNYNQGTASGVQVTSNHETQATVAAAPRPGTLVLVIDRFPRSADDTFPSAFRAAVSALNQTLSADFQNDRCTINSVNAGPVTVTISDVVTDSGYPQTVFNLQMPPEGNISRTVELAPLDIGFTRGNPDHQHTEHAQSIDPGEVVDAPSGGLEAPDTEVVGWLRVWRDWLVLTKPERGVDPTKDPSIRVTGITSSTNLVESEGFVVYFSASGARAAAMPWSRSVATIIPGHETP